MRAGVVKLTGMSTTYPCIRSSLAQSSGEPLERGPRPLQSCITTTAGKGPRPWGFNNLAAICSDAPLPVVVLINNPEVVELHPAIDNIESTEQCHIFSIVFAKKNKLTNVVRRHSGHPEERPRAHEPSHIES